MPSANGVEGVGPSGDIPDALIGQWSPFQTEADSGGSYIRNPLSEVLYSGEYGEGVEGPIARGYWQIIKQQIAVRLY